jgi:circadian clock protein KaiC
VKGKDPRAQPDTFGCALTFRQGPVTQAMGRSTGSLPKASKRGGGPRTAPLRKSPTGIKGLDSVLEGGLPMNRTTLVCGSTGSGKTLFGLDFLVKGVLMHKEPGVFMSFEETADELFEDRNSIDADLPRLVAQGKLRIEHVLLERKDVMDHGEFNLEGLFAQLENAIDSIGAKRVVLDSIESLFAGVTDAGILRLEVKRLFRWFKTKQITAIVTGEIASQKGTLTHHGLEEFISDCIILLDNRVKSQVAVRRIRIVKYRGSSHGTNEYPFLIDASGLSVIPITSAGLDQPGTTKRVSTGIAALDKLFRGGGYTRGSTVLVSGTAGTGKTSLAIAFTVAACRRGERCLFLSYEESSGQLIQNMKSIGFDLTPFVKRGLLRIKSMRPSFFGLETHLLNLHKTIEEFKPRSVVLDPLTSLLGQGDTLEVQSLVTRMIDLLKTRGVTAFFTSLVPSTMDNYTSGEIGVSSLIDTWIVVRELEEDEGRKRIRGIYIVKSRGTSHSSDIHRLVLGDKGVSLAPMDAKVVGGPNQKRMPTPKRPREG